MSDYKGLVNTFYMKQYKLLKLFALWELSADTPAGIRLAYRVYFWYFLIFWLLLIDFSMILQLIANFGNVDEIIKVFVIFATAMAVMGKYLYIKVRNQDFEALFRMLHLPEFLPLNHVERQIFRKAAHMSQQVRNYYGTLSVSALSALLSIQLLGEEKEFPASIYNPFDMDSDFKYGVMYGYQCISLAVLCFINVGFDSLVSSYLINIKAQLDMLAYRLENIGHGGTTQDGIMRQLKDCIIYYQRIWELTHLMEDLVCMPMSIQIACSVFVLIANFYAMSLLSDTDELGNFVKFILYQTCMLTQIFILCYFANEVSIKSSEISFNLYKSDWYDWNKINRKMVLQMMIRFETPIRIKSVNRCYSFSLEAFTSIVNSSYSYFALLKRVNS